MILALMYQGAPVGTLTLNRVTRAFPSLAAHLEKGVSCVHPHFRSPDAIEFVKGVLLDEYRSSRAWINVFFVACLVAHTVGKRHFWNVSRTDPAALRFMERVGFVYDRTFAFVDSTLNDTASCLGYCHLPDIPLNPHVSPSVRRFVKSLLTQTAAVRGSAAGSAR